MKAVAFDLMRADGLGTALAGLKDNGLAVKVLAGGQSLGPMLNLRLAQPERVIDIRSLPELCSAKVEGEVLTIGAGVTHARIEDGLVPDVTQGLMPFVASNIAYRAIRNRGTLGGSLAHADPAADWVSTMMLLDATIMIAALSDASGQGQAHITQREVKAQDFMTGPFSTVLADHEVITAVRVPALSSSARWGYYKFCRKTGEFAEAIGAVLSDPPRGICRLVMGATDSKPWVLAQAAALVHSPDAASLNRLLEDAGVSEDPYARQQHRTAVLRAIAMLQHQPQGRAS